MHFQENYYTLKPGLSGQQARSPHTWMGKEITVLFSPMFNGNLVSFWYKCGPRTIVIIPVHGT